MTARKPGKGGTSDLAPAAMEGPPEGDEGLVAAVYSGKFLVWRAGREWVCSLRGRQRREARPVVGDRVLLTTHPDGSGTILTILPRRNALTRRQADRARRGRPAAAQVLAANVDQLVIVAALREPPFREGLVERLLAAAAVAGMEPLLCISKIDLDGGGEFDALCLVYRALPLAVLGVTIRRPETLAALGAALAGKTSVLAGHSGVGKTSLLNELVERQMAVGDLGGAQVARGRHTTSTARLIPLRGGGFAIDSPGVKEFGLHGPAPSELARHYPDFGPHLDHCGFRDCMHRSEPGCAVLAAVEAGEVSQARYRSYRTLLEELEEPR
ncbi:MAG: ribosome small subunit-dependent GTPase A [bacterium]